MDEKSTAKGIYYVIRMTNNQSLKRDKTTMLNGDQKTEQWIQKLQNKLLAFASTNKKKLPVETNSKL